MGVQYAETSTYFLFPYVAAIRCYAPIQDEGITTTKQKPYNIQRPAKDEEAPRYQIDFRGIVAYRDLTVSIRNRIQREKNKKSSRGKCRAGVWFHLKTFSLANLKQGSIWHL